jgi:sporulation protein YlmC with PRC-barrel domain
VSGATEYAIGAKAYCEDGACGDLERVVIDPIKAAITHVVVKRPHGHDVGRLVPIDLIESTTEQEVRLRCTRAEFEALDYAKETEFMPAPEGQWTYGPNQAWQMPYFGLWGTGDMGGGQPGGLVAAGDHDRVPPGEVEVRRGQRVHASDGAIGHVRGLVVDPSDDKVTHVLLDEGHLWGKKEVSIPISAVTEVGDGVRLKLTKAEVAELPPVDVREHGGLSGGSLGGG